MLTFSQDSWPLKYKAVSSVNAIVASYLFVNFFFVELHCIATQFGPDVSLKDHKQCNSSLGLRVTADVIRNECQLVS